MYVCFLQSVCQWYHWYVVNCQSPLAACISLIHCRCWTQCHLPIHVLRGAVLDWFCNYLNEIRWFVLQIGGVVWLVRAVLHCRWLAAGESRNLAGGCNDDWSTDRRQKGIKLLALISGKMGRNAPACTEFSGAIYSGNSSATPQFHAQILAAIARSPERGCEMKFSIQKSFVLSQ